MKRAGALGAVLCVLIFGLPLIAVLLTNQAAADELTSCASLPVGSTLPDGSTLNITEADNAQAVYDIIVSSGVPSPQRAAIDALDAGWTESRMTNVDGGTGGAYGIFQETPADGWGTPAQVMNIDYATAEWLAHLVNVAGWQQQAPAVVDQEVERSGFPKRYYTWTNVAIAEVSGLNGAAADCDNGSGLVGSGGTTHIPSGFKLPAGTPEQVQVAIAYALAQLGKPYSETIDGGVGPDDYDCSGLVMMAYRAAGIDLPRTTYQQYLVGQTILGVHNLRPGDLIFIPGSDPGPNGAPGHVVMYIGSGLIIQAPYSGQVIQIDPLSLVQSQIVTIQRIVVAGAPPR